MDSQIFEVKANGEARDVQREDLRDAEEEEDYKSQPQTGDGASPGKIFIGGLARETTSVQFIKHFGKYGEIIDSVIMKDRTTGQPRGFGFITYADPSVVDKVIQDTHVINGKQVEIKRTIPKGAAGSKDFKTKKIFVGGIPATVNEDEFRDFFSQFGEVKEHQVMRDHSTGRSRGFGFVTFESEQSVDDLLVKGKKLDFAGVQVEIKKAEPKKPNAPPPPSKRYNDSRPGFGGGYKDSYGAYGGSSYGGRDFGSSYGGRDFGSSYGGRDFGSSGSFRSAGAYSGRSSAYGGGGGGYGGSEFGGYGVYGGMGGFGAHRGEPSVYSGRYGGAFNRGFDLGGAYGGSGEDYGPYVGGGSGGAASGGGGGYGNNYDTGMGSGYVGGGSAGSFYGSRGGYSGAGNSRYHPYGR